MEDLLQKIIECKSEEEVKEFVDEALAKQVEGSKKVGELGAWFRSTIYEGFIHPDTRMRISNAALATYGMSTTDYLYEYAILVWKVSILHDARGLVDGLVPFLNMYFGITVPGKDERDDFLTEGVTLSDTDQDEFFETIMKHNIGDLKGKGIAACMERSAVAQNILSLFGFDSFFCVGVVQHGDSYEDHAFNIIRFGNRYLLVDCSKAVPQKQLDGKIIYKPFYAEIPADKIEDFMHNKVAIGFRDYEIVETSEGLKTVPLGERQYIAGTAKDDLKTGMKMGS